MTTNKAASLRDGIARQQMGTAWGREVNAECRAFSAWAHDYVAAPASERTSMEARGVLLAADRREAVKKLIATDPAAALAAAVPVKVRSALPEAIVAKLEQRVSGRGDLTVLVAEPLPGQHIDTEYRRVASIDGQHYAAHVFGARAGQRTTEHDSLHGIAVDGELAILESPLRLLEDGEQPSAGKKIVNASTAQHSTTTESAPVFESGDTVYVGCCQQHVAAQQQEWLAASGGSVPASGGPNASAYRTTGNRSILVMIAKLSGGTSMITQAQAQAGIDQIATWAQQASFQQLTFTTKTVTTELTLPKTKSEYQALGDTTGPQTLLTDARAAAVAASAAYDTNNFDFDIVVYESTFGFSGLGTVGGKKCWIQLGTVGQFETSTTAHELGHNLGLNHAGVWVRPSGSTNPIDPAGNFQDYGSLFDALGLGGYPKGHYSTHFKYMLGWVPGANIHTVTSPTTSALRIYAHDAGVSLDPARKYGLRVAVSNTVGAGRRDYWMDVRTLYTDRPNSQNGVTLQWGDEKGSPQGSALIDTTPNSNTSQGTLGDFVDAPLAVGSSFTDSTCGVTITPIASGGSGSDKYVDVQVTTPDADLTALALSTGTLSPGFSASTLSYSASVSSSTTSVTVTPTASASSSTIQVRVNGGTFSTVASGTSSGALALNPGPNTVDVKVTATGGLWSKTYSVSVSTMPAIAGTGYGPIPDGVGTSRDITFTISGLSGTVSNVLVDFTLNPAHTYSSDVKAVLIAPDSTQHVVASFTHLNDNSRLAGPYLFSDLATGTLGAAITATAGGVDVPSGSFRTQNNNETATSLVTTFSGKAPNGTWTLRFTDLWAGDTGTVSAANLYLATTTPAAPELAVFTGASTAAGDERTDNTGTQTFASTNVGSTSSAQTFTLKNTGTADITGLTISKTGDFTITQPAVTTLAPDATSTFTVTFAPTARGTLTGVISIASNDADENPFEINVSGAGLLLPVPVLSYFANGNSVFFNAHNEPLPGAPIPTSGGVVYARTDTNTAPLIGGSGVTNLDAELVNSGFDGLSAEFTPGVSYTFRAYLINADGVGYSSPETVTFSPEIAVFNGASTSAADERTDNTGTFTFANTNVGSTSSAQTFTIKNVGNFLLTSLAVTKTGDFTVTQPFSSGVTPGLEEDGTTTFTVTFAPTAAGTRTGVISIASNDADENPFEINVSGTGALQVPSLGTTFASPTDITALIIQTGRNDNGSPITEAGVVWSVNDTNATPLIGGEGVTRVAFPTITDSTLELFSLTPSTTYAVRTYAINAGGTGYSDVVTFTTKAGQPFFVMEEGGQAVASTVLAWGSDDAGQVLVPADLRDVEDVAAGHQFSMAKKRGGSLVMWGQGAQGQTTVPSDVVRAKSISAAAAPIVTMGNYNYARTWGGTAVPLPSSANYFFSVSAGNAHVLAVTGSHQVRAWGDDTSGQSTVPSSINSGFSASRPQVSAGGDFSSALKDGSVYVWGANATGNLSVPGDLGTVTAIDAGDAHMLALKNDGTVRAWGSNTHGQTNVPVGLTGVQSVSAGSTMSAAVKGDGSVVTWGGVPSDVPQPSQLKNISKVSAGDSHLLAVQLPELVFASSAIGVEATKTLTLRNAGAVEGSTPGLGLSGPQASAFVLNATSTTVAAGSTQTFTITYTPTTVGNSHATLTMTDFTGTMEVALTGYVVLPPEITVFKGTEELSDNTGTQTFANTAVGSTSSAQTFTLKNTGTADLTGLAITQTGDFTITQPAVTTLAPDATTTFTVSFVPTATGTRSGVISIASDDADENPFEINVSGTGVAPGPEIAVFTGGTDPANERTDNTGTFTFADNGVGVTSDAQIIVIKNTGTADLTGIAITKTGDFTITSPVITALAPGASMSIYVRFVPTALGPRTGVISIASNDADENPFEINLSGTGVVAVPSLAGLERTSLDSTSASFQASITSDGGDSITERGVLLQPSTSAGPLIVGGEGVVKIISTDTSPTFNVAASELTPDTRYYAVAYAINSVGTGYSGSTSFYAPAPSLPVVTVELQTDEAGLPTGLLGTVVDSGGGVFTHPGTSRGFRHAKVDAHIDPRINIGSGFGVSGLSITDAAAPFTRTLQSLAPGSYVGVAYARNTRGYGFSELVYFTIGSVGELVVEENGKQVASAAQYGGSLTSQFQKPPVALTDPVSLSSNAAVAARRTDGSFLVWGPYAPVAIPSTGSGLKSVAGSSGHILALGNDGVVTTAWRKSTVDPAASYVQVPADIGPVVAIATAKQASFAVKANGTVVAWGDPVSNYDYTPDTVLQVPAGLSDVIHIHASSGSNRHALALKRNGTVVAWGANGAGQCNVPADLTDVIAIEAGQDFSLALRRDGTTVAWGRVSAPPSGLGLVKAIASVGYDPVYLLRDGTVVTSSSIGVPVELTGVSGVTGDSALVTMLLGGLHFADQSTGTTSAVRTLTLTNKGNAPLTFTSISVVGLAASDFAITAAPTTLAAGESATVNVTFQPTAGGERYAALRMLSNDPDNPTRDVVLTGTATAASNSEIAVFNGASTDAGDERTDDTGTQTFANTNVGSTSSAQTFTIKNTGTADLTGLVITKTGDFTVTQPALTTLAPDATTTFTVSFVPTATGARTGVISIASNDADENPFEINVSGTGVELTHPEIAVFNGRNTDAANERTDNTGTLSFANTTVGSGSGSAAQTFTIKNTGVDPLIGLVVTKTGDFALTQPMLTTLAPNATTTFTVAFTPTAEGTRTGVISIASNDADENPFEINVTGEGQSDPALSETIVSGITATGASFHADLGRVAFIAETGFVVSATAVNDLPDHGASDVQVVNGSQISIGSHVTDGSIGNLVPATSYSVRAFIVTGFIYAETYYQYGPVTTFTTAPSDGSAAQDIAIIHPDHLAEGAMFTTNDIANGGSYAFGSHVGGFPIVRTIGIANRGDSPLVISSIAFTAESSSAFSLTTPTLPLTIAPRGVISVPMSFAPPADAATFSATLRVLSDDSDEATTDITITGDRVIQAPTVTTPIGTTLTFEKARFTASVPLDGGRPVTERGFVYRVPGVGSTTLVVPGTTGEFSTVVDHLPTIVGVVFVRAYAINSVGPRYSDEFYYEIPEFVPGPTIAVFKGESTAGDPLTDNDGTQSLGELLVGGTTTQTFTIKNTGTEALTGLTLEKDGSHTSDFTSTALVGTLAPDATTTITITFSPGATGTRSASFAIGTPDTTLNPFEINVTGTGVATPTVTTPTVTNITPGRATLGGTIESDGGSPITERGIVWTNSNAGQEQVIGGVGAHQVIASGTDTGVFTVDVSGFTGGGVFFKAYAKNANVTSYSSVSSFLSLRALPTLVLEDPAEGTDYTTSAAARTFTLRNTGTQTLTISGVILQGSNPDSFVLDTTGMATTLAASATTTFTLAAAPNVFGNVSAQMIVTSDDAGQPSLARNVSGYGALPLKVEFTDEIGTRLKPTSAPVTATPTSSIDGVKDGGFVLSLASVNSLPEIGGTGVTLGGDAFVFLGVYQNCQTLFTDLLPGQDYVVRPYVHFTGNATTFYGPIVSFKPHFDGPGVILLGEDGTELTSVSFPLQAVGTTSVTRVFTLRNDGDQAADFVGYGFQLRSPQLSQFSSTQPVLSHLEPGEQTTFTMAFAPTSAGTITNILYIAGIGAGDVTNDVSYPFTATAGEAPEISAFTGASTDPADELQTAGTQAMSAGVGSSSTRTFTVKNVGSTDLTDLALSFSNQSSKDFSFTPPAVTTLAAGESTTFTVSFSPAVGGTTSAKLRIASNDSDENPFAINFTGTSVAGAPQLLIEQAEGLAIGGFLTAWGTDTDGQITFPSYLANVKQVATGVTHTLELQTNGHVASFGSNDYGERSAPAGLAGVASIAAGDRISVAVKSDGTVAAWGDDSSGAVTALSALTNVKSVDTHDSGSWVALRNDGTVATGGSLGTVPAELPVIKAIASGQHHALALSEDGHVIAWASTNDFGEANVPEGLSNVIAIAAGLQHSMALKLDGTVVVWGGARAAERSVPEGMANVVKIECGEENCFVVHADGTVSTWGPDGFYGTSSPPALQDVTSVSAAARHAVAIIGGLKFGTQRVGGDSYLRSIILRNTGSAPLTISDATIIGTHPGDFTIHTAPASPIAPGESSTMAVEFVPTAAGHRMAKLRFNSDDTAQAVVTIPLHGDAIDPKPPTGHDRVLTIHEDESIVLTTNTFGFEDIAQSPQDSPVGIKIITLPAHGTLWNYDVEITEAGVVVPDWNDLRYAPQPDASGSPYDSFTLQLVDSGPSDVNLSTVLTATINVLPASEPPEGTDKTITVAPNGRHVFTPEEFGFSDPNDTPPNRFKSVLITQFPEAGRLVLNGKPLGYLWFGAEPLGAPIGEPDGTVVNFLPVPGNQWTYHGPEHDWQGIASSADGSKLIAAGSVGNEAALLYTSTDGGQTWTPSGNEGNYYAVTSSADGSVLYAARSHYYQSEGPPSTVLKSTDGGQNWSELPLTGDDFWVLATSANGQVIAAMDGGMWNWTEESGYVHTGGALRLSTDGGATFTTHLLGKELMGVDCSADGQIIVAITQHNFFISKNGGSTWSAEFEGDSNDYNWRAITCSADGQHLFIAASHHGIRVSHDAGTTWTDGGFTGYFLQSIACSDDGKIVVATPDYGRLHVSLNGGETWEMKDEIRDWLSSSVSGDGSRLFAGSQTRTNFNEAGLAAFFEEAVSTDGHIAISSASIDELVYIPGEQRFILAEAGSSGTPSDGFIFHVVDDGDPAGNTDLSGNVMAINLGDRLADPIFTNLAATNITPTTATLGATLVNEEGAFITDLGFEYHQTVGENTYNYTAYADVTQSGPFTAYVPDVLTNVPVIYRAFATFSDGSTAYSDERSFIPSDSRPLAVGNLVFWDKNNNGHADAGEGIDGVTVQLYGSTQEIGESTPLRTTTTANGGFYLFDELASGFYRLAIPPTMFAEGAPLWKMKSVPGVLSLGDDDVGEKGQDSSHPEENGARTESFLLIAGSAPVEEAGLINSGTQPAERDLDIDLTRDFGFIDQTEKSESFEKWKQRHGGGSGDDQDDLLKYALGGEDDQGNPDAHFDIEDNHETDQTNIRVRRRHGSQPDVTYTVQVCPDLSGARGEWEGTVIIPTIINNGDGTETLIFPDVMKDPALQDSQFGFTRLIVRLTGSDGSVRETSISNILGWQHRPLQLRTQTFGLPFVRPAVFTGKVAAMNGNTLTVSGTPGVASSLIAGEHYYVEVISGANEGHRFELNESQTTDTVLVLDLADALSTQSSVAASIVGDVIAVRPHWRVKDVFPPSEYHAAASASLSDQLQVWNPATSGYITLFRANSPTLGSIWAAAGPPPLTSQNDRIIGPADGLFAKPRLAVVSAMDGQVRTWKFACPLRAGINLIGNPYPVAQSLAGRLMTTATGFHGATEPDSADRIFFWTGDGSGGGSPGYQTFYLFDDGVHKLWAQAGETSGFDHSNDLIFAPGTASFISVNQAIGAWVMPAAVAP